MANHAHKSESFTVAPDHPLAAEHEAVAAWITEAIASLPKGRYYGDVELKSLPTGQRLLEGTPAQARRYVRAAIDQAHHWDRAGEAIRNAQKSEAERQNVHSNPAWQATWGCRRKAEAVVRALLRRTLPFDRDDLLAMLEWASSDSSRVSSFFAPFGAIAKTVERYVASHELDPDLRAAVQRLAEILRTAYDKDVKRHATPLEQIVGASGAVVGEEGDAPADTPALATPEPASAGTAGVLLALKRSRGMLPAETDGSTKRMDPDQFAMAEDSPLAAEHAMLSPILEEAVQRSRHIQDDQRHLASWSAIQSLSPEGRGRVLLAAAERHAASLIERAPAFSDDGRVWKSRYVLPSVVASIGRDGEIALSRDGLFDILLYQSSRPAESAVVGPKVWLPRLKGEVEAAPLSEGERYVLALLRASLIGGPPLGAVREEVRTLTVLIGDGAGFFLAPGEVWADAVNAELSRLAPAARENWVALMGHALAATSSRPSAKWLKEAKRRIDAIGPETVREAILRWLPLVNHGRSHAALPSNFADTRAGDVMNEENANALRGLLWLSPMLPERGALARAITAVALSAYRKVPGVGPRAVKVGNAAVYALSELGSVEAVGQLAMLKVRVRFGSAQKEIEKAFAASAEALSLPRDEVEEMGVPAYGLEEVGRRVETFGDYRAELTVDGADATLQWFDAKGKALKSVPAVVKKEHKEDLADWQQSVKDIAAMLPAQRDRIDGLFRSRRTWKLTPWRERYLDHPLVGTIARRLLWIIDGVPVLYHDGQLADVSGKVVIPGDAAEVALWHPAVRPVDEVLAWRRRLEELAVTQPFKQAHREVYLLTDAERRTNTYSNRFAGHIIRQHQFNALCAARGWKNRLRLMVDDSFPPATIDLPEWDLRAEYWIEGIGDDYGADTNESGVYLRLSTDQVRFYRRVAAENYAHAGGGGYTTEAAGPGDANVNLPLPLDQIPPLIFSEVLRDVDLFVGVASVGNDPTWQDGGPDGRFRDYWQGYSFGELSGTAHTRKAVLERLIPRLKIASQCTFSDRFLIVRGSRRTYKIHLGSGNILMEPNDQYLCIVPDAKARVGEQSVFLPFEGDGTLSIILSKALLLADDAKIKDPTINQQIDNR